MKNELVVKDNALINASYNLEVTEQRLILLSIVRARETGQGITADSKLEIHASDYAKQFNTTNEAAYEALKGAVNNLFERQFSFREEYKRTGKTGVVRSRWVSRIKYVDELAILELTFAPDVVPLITRLEQHFTSYQIEQLAHVTSKYGIRLYEILISWKSVGKTPVLEINDLRFKLGIELHEYKQMGHFKSRVLEPAIKQINEFTDIKAEYLQHKSGRTITGFEFKFKLKNQPPKENKLPKDQNTIDMFTNMTPKQVLLFANKLAHDDQFGGRVGEVGESREDLERRLADLLVDPRNQQKWADDLKRLGFNA
jgi:plasmid replication initiation protein